MVLTEEEWSSKEDKEIRFTRHPNIMIESNGNN